MKNSSFACLRALLLLGLGLVALLPSVTLASIHIWIGPQGGQWSVSGYWNGGVPTSNESGGTVVVFGNNTVSTFDIPGLKVNQIVFNGPGNVINGVPNTHLSVSGLAAQDNIWSKAGNDTFGGTLLLDYVDAAPVYIRVDNSILTMAAATYGSSGIRKLGTGEMTLTAHDNFNTGPTYVAEGVLSLNSGGAESSVLGDITVGTGSGTGAYLSLKQALEIKDSASVTVNSDGFFITTGFSETIANLTVVDGSVNHSTGPLTVNGALSMTGGLITGTTGSLNLQGDVTATSSTGESATIYSLLPLPATRVFTVNDGPQANDMTLSGLISGTAGAGLTKGGTGTLLLSQNSSNTNTYTGPTTVNQGVLFLNGGSSSVIPGPLVIGSGSGAAGSAIVRLGQVSEISNTAPVSVKSDGILDLAGFNDIIGALSIDRGSVTLGATSTFTPTSINMSAGSISGSGTSVLTLAGDLTASSAAGSPATISPNMALTATRNFTVNQGGSAPDLILVGRISENPTSSGFGLTKLGSGTMNLAGTTDTAYTGTTTVSAGTLQLNQNGHRAIVGPLVVGNNVDPAGTATLRELLDGGLQPLIDVALNKSGVIDMNGHADSIDELSGTGRLYLPTVGANASRLTVGSGSSSTFNFAGTFEGSGTFEKVGPSTLTLSGKLIAAFGRLAVSDGVMIMNLGAGTASPNLLQVGDGSGTSNSAIARLGADNLLSTGGTVEVKQDGTLEVNGKTAATKALSITNGTVKMTGGSLSVGNLTMVSGAVAGSSGGTLTLSGTLSATTNSGSPCTITSKLALEGNTTFAINPGLNSPNTELQLSGAISDGPSGPGGFFKSGSGRMLISNANSYSGLTTIDRGTLDVGSGFGVSIPGPLVIGNDIDAAASAIVKVAPTANVGLGSNVTIKASGKYDATGSPAGAGTLSGTGPLTLGADALTLGGSSTATYDGLISGSGGLIKSGSGLQIFTQNNTYTGGTNVTGGKLYINGTQTGVFTVGAAGTLGGFGTVGPTLNANTAGARVAPGSGLGSSPAVLHVNGTANLNNGKLVVRLNDATVLKNDQLAVTGNLSINGATVLPVPLGPVSSNPHVIASFGGSLTGTFASVPPGCAINYAYNDGVSTNNIAITVTNAWQAWLAGYELNPANTGLPDADPDGDGIPNGIEFVLGLDPTAKNGSTDLPGGTNSGSNYLFTFRRAGAAIPYNPVVQTSTTLAAGSWTNVASGITVDSNFYGAGIDRVTVTISRAGKPKLFARLRIDGL